MDEKQPDMNMNLMLDGNAVAGMLYEMFDREMTTAPAECANCGNQGELGSLLAFTQAPGIVLRCPACQSVVLRVVLTDKWVYLDARGAAHIRMERRA